MIKLGIVGTGGMAHDHASNFAKIKDNFNIKEIYNVEKNKCNSLE